MQARVRETLRRGQRPWLGLFVRSWAVHIVTGLTPPRAYPPTPRENGPNPPMTPNPHEGRGAIRTPSPVPQPLGERPPPQPLPRCDGRGVCPTPPQFPNPRGEAPSPTPPPLRRERGLPNPSPVPQPLLRARHVTLGEGLLDGAIPVALVRRCDGYGDYRTWVLRRRSSIDRERLLRFASRSFPPPGLERVCCPHPRRFPKRC